MSEKSDLDPGDLSDRWQQMTEIEAKRVYEITLQNELSGATKAVRDFETRWRKWTGARYALTTANGSSALFCAYFGLGVGPGDEVICWSTHKTCAAGLTNERGQLLPSICGAVYAIWMH